MKLECRAKVGTLVSMRLKLIHLSQEQSTEASEKTAFEMALESRIEETEPSTMEIGKITEQTGKENFDILTEMCSKGNESMTKRMGEAFIYTLTAPGMKESERTTCKMDQGLKAEQMARDMKATTKPGRSMGEGSTSDLMDLCMKETECSTESKEKGSILGQMGGGIAGNGGTTTCMERGSTLELMAEGMKANTEMTRSLDMECIDGQMEGCIKGCGKKENRMDEAVMCCQMGRKGLEFGKMVRDCSGFKTKQLPMMWGSTPLLMNETLFNPCL